MLGSELKTESELQVSRLLHLAIALSPPQRPHAIVIHPMYGQTGPTFAVAFWSRSARAAGELYSPTRAPYGLPIRADCRVTPEAEAPRPT